MEIFFFFFLFLITEGDCARAGSRGQPCLCLSVLLPCPQHSPAPSGWVAAAESCGRPTGDTEHLGTGTRVTLASVSHQCESSGFAAVVSHVG